MASRRWLDPSPVRSSTAPPAPLPSSEPGPLSSDFDGGSLDSDDRRSPSPSDGRSNNPRKRPAQDMSQYADRTARHLRLKLESTEALRYYSQLSAPEQSVWLAGRILLLGEVTATLQPPEAVYHIPATLEGAILEYHFLVLIDPQASSYVKKGKGSPLERLTAQLIKLPTSGLTATIMHDKQKSDVITTRMRYRLTQTRNVIKDLIGDSLPPPQADDHNDDEPTSGMDIITLCQRVLAVGSKSSNDLKVSVEMCARFAFLRETYVTMLKENGSNRGDFWGQVDKNLTQLREAKDQDAARISQVLSDILADDRKLYGSADIESLIQVSPVFPV